MAKGKKNCPQCDASIHAASTSCPQCGHEMPREAPRDMDLPEFAAGIDSNGGLIISWPRDGEVLALPVEHALLIYKVLVAAGKGAQ